MFDSDDWISHLQFQKQKNQSDIISSPLRPNLDSFKGFLSFTEIFCANKVVKIQVVYLGTALPTGAEIVCLLNSSEPERAEISNI